MNKLSILLIVCLFFLQCKEKEVHLPITNTIVNEIPRFDTIANDQHWHLKDIIQDTIPGISYYKAYNTLLKHKTTTPTIIAILDTKIDRNHEALKNKIWLNPKEIPNNGIDDDKNGYIDDINGWNFLGNDKGESIVVDNYEFIRIVRHYKERFENPKNTDTISPEYENYRRAKKHYEKRLTYYKKSYEWYREIMNDYYESRSALQEYFPDYKYSYEKLNKIDTLGNGLDKYVNTIKEILDYEDTDENLERNYVITINDYIKKVNINYLPRKLVGDDPSNINDSIYGNNKVSDYTNIITHGTRVSGYAASIIETDNIKLMPIVICPKEGNTQDKDIALSIKYAVNNGAKVINMSFGKNFSFNSTWLKEAFLYAEQHNVLIVAGAGNSGKNLDNELHTYPKDSYNNEPEFCDNFLLVGASSKDINSNLITFSDYGKEKVDVFAPGVNVYTTLPNNNYHFDSGSSLSSSLTASVAALLFSYYPNLTASQVKHIIMDSGIEYTFPVKTPTKEDKTKTTPFNEISKSGKIVNVYNALIMADEISKQRK